VFGLRLSVFLETHVEQLFARILKRFLASSAPRAEEIVSKQRMDVMSLGIGRQVAATSHSNEGRVIPVQDGHAVRLTLHDVARQRILNIKVTSSI